MSLDSKIIESGTLVSMTTLLMYTVAHSGLAVTPRYKHILERKKCKHNVFYKHFCLGLVNPEFHKKQSRALGEHPILSFSFNRSPMKFKWLFTIKINCICWNELVQGFLKPRSTLRSTLPLPEVKKFETLGDSSLAICTGKFLAVQNQGGTFYDPMSQCPLHCATVMGRVTIFLLGGGKERLPLHLRFREPPIFPTVTCWPKKYKHR